MTYSPRSPFVLVFLSALVLVPTDAAAQIPLSCGQLVNGSIDAALEADQFTFSGDPGDSVTIAAVQTGVIDPMFFLTVELFRPGRTTSQSLGQGIFTTLLSERGTFTIRLADFAGSRRGTYAVRLYWNQPLSKQCGDRAPLPCGQTVAGALSSPYEQDLYTFSGVLLQSVTITIAAVAAAEPNFAVFGSYFSPAGTGPLTFGQGSPLTTSLGTVGTFIVRVNSGAAGKRGTYTVRYDSPSCGPPQPGQPPGPPRDLTASVAGFSVTLTWNAPTTGGAPTSYVLEAGSVAGSANLLTFDTDSVATSFFAAAPPGIYFVRVKARNAAGTSAASNEAIVTVGMVPGACTAPPGAPAGLASTVAGQFVTLRWNAPGGPVTSYVVEAGSLAGANNLGNFATGNSTSFSGVATPGTYFVRVRARNDCGTGPISNEIIVNVF